MSVNSFGRLFRMTTWGESHGPAIGVVVDGCPPRIELSESDVQPWLDRRRPGASPVTSQRNEPDRVRILSGTFGGQTTGTPISLLIDNIDPRPEEYGQTAPAFRPGHADYAYQAKYGTRDWRGGGRSSARETAARVAAGAIARRVVPEVAIRAYLFELGGDAIDRAAFDPAEIDRNPFFSPDAAAAARWARAIEQARAAGSSLGAVVECVADGVPAGWGAPVYAKLDAELAGPVFLSNPSGGLAGGISTGQPVVIRVAFKPTSSIAQAVETLDVSGAETEVATRGRHDPCVGIRGVAVVEAMMALVLADQKLLHRAQCG